MAMRNGNLELLAPDNCALVLMDYQARLLFGVKSLDRDIIINNVVGLAKAAEAFSIPIVISTISAKAQNGPLFMDLQAKLPKAEPLDRSTLNACDDSHFTQAIKQTGRKKLVLSALWSHASLTYTALSLLANGYEVYPVTDTSGAPTRDAHMFALQRLIQAGAIPVTWQQVMFEWQRDWARQETAEYVREITRAHFGAFSQSLVFPAMAGERAGAHATPPRAH